jgi:hypothetical protein
MRFHCVLASFTVRGQSWRNVAWNKEAFCVLESAKIAKFDIWCVTKGGHIEHL